MAVPAAERLRSTSHSGGLSKSCAFSDPLNSNVRFHMMFSGNREREKQALVAALCFLLSGLMFCSWATFEGIPARTELQSASGRVVWVEKRRYGVHFRLKGVPREFFYSSKGDGMDLIYDSLSRSDSPVFTVLYSATNPSGPIYSNEKFYTIFELSVEGAPVRSHAQIDAAWLADENLAPWLAAFFFLGGIYLILLVFFKKAET